MVEVKSSQRSYCPHTCLSRQRYKTLHPQNYDQTMEIDSDGDKAFELEDASTTIKEAPNPVATASLDTVPCRKFLDLPPPK